MLKGHFPLRDGEGGSFAVDSARVDHPSLRRLRQQDGVLIEQALAGDGDGVEDGEEQGHHQKDEQDNFLVGGQRADSLHTFYLLALGQWVWSAAKGFHQLFQKVLAAGL